MDRCRARTRRVAYSYPGVVVHLWLAGQPWGLARKGKKSIKYRPTQPVFFTGPHKLRHPTNDRRKETMMENRMRYFKFDRPIVKVDRRIRPCARCFARWVLRLD